VATPALAAQVRPYQAGVALGVGVLALAASTLHLGRPLYAWRAVIGFGHSWLSREIVAFGAFAGLAALYAGGVLVDVSPSITRPLGALTALVGMLGVLASVMIYVVTGRKWWRVSHTGTKFGLSALLTGASAVSFAALAAAATDATMVTPVLTDIVRPLSLLVAGSTLLKLAGEVSVFRHLRDATYTDLRRTAMLMADDLHVVTVWRYFAGLVGGVALPLVLVAMTGNRPPIAAVLLVSLVGLGASTAGELCERWQFFTASTAPRMPGVQQ
jgi:DMSO reductase anchor subunit